MNIADYIKKQEKAKNEQASSYVDPNEAVKKYSQLSENELMQELLKEGSVSNGKVSEEELDNFYNHASGFLSHEQKAKMKNLINMLKKN